MSQLKVFVWLWNAVVQSRGEIEAFARVCRVERIVGPYLEALS